MHVNLMGKRWRWRYVPKLSHWGECQLADPPSAGKEIVINGGEAEAELLLDIELHEATHAAFPWIKEESVNQFATDMARILWRLGYRKQ